MPEASSTDFSPAGTPSESADIRQDTWSLSPAEAGEILAERAGDFAAQVPSAEAIQDVHDARLRLTALMNTESWVRNFMSGSIAEKREFEALTQMIANEAEGAHSCKPPLKRRSAINPSAGKI
jgi:hypothetical protein